MDFEKHISRNLILHIERLVGSFLWQISNDELWGATRFEPVEQTIFERNYGRLSKPSKNKQRHH